MARKEMLVTESDAKMDAVNLDFRVGAGGENHKDDVMVVQSLFRYISLEQDHARRFLGNIVIPKIDGICGGVTLRAISHFQHKHAHRLLRVDGVIHPANYGKRHVGWMASSPVMTITLLHFFAWHAWSFQGTSSHPDQDYIGGLIRIEPRLKNVLIFKIDI
jgi:hypothetical protein